jgi:hypothetical protein
VSFEVDGLKGAAVELNEGVSGGLGKGRELIELDKGLI